jgi:hypothetical protein
MRTAVVVLVVLGAADLAAVGLLLAVVWAEHRRQRRLARDAGQPVPPPATGQFAFLAAVGLVGILFLYAVGVFLLDG